MSYILDALRRAESERERGSIPTLHSRSTAVEPSDEPGGAVRARPWLWAAALALPTLAAAVWWLWPVERRDDVAVALPQTSAAPALAIKAASSAPELVRLQPPPPLAVPATPPLQSIPIAAAAPQERSAAPPPLQSELPEALRRQLPPLAVGGAMDSQTPASRMLIVNGQVLREGEQIAPDLLLEQISLRGAVLVFRGQRFRIAY
jgi:general secretion pathway protein B